MILTDAAGKPIPKPSMLDYPTAEAYCTAFYAWKDRVAAVANESFDQTFKKAVR